jgi:putative spermidine/putrescine transport system ATP-binding protein
MPPIVQSPDSVLELRAVRKKYGTQIAVDSLDLSLRRHEFLTFLGPSGSGKTTTLMMVAGLQQPDAGSIALNGQPVDRLPAYRRDIGMVFQHYALFPHMTIRRNVAFPLEMRGVARAEANRLVGDALLMVGLAELGERLPRQLSGGQQQRAALARAMVYGPALLLMDEPLGALDKKLREQMQLEIKRVHRERRISVLYVTHDQEEALTMSDRIAVFNNGRIEQIGTPAELYERPATRFVAGFIGETNFFAGSVISVQAATCEVELGGTRLLAVVRGGLSTGTRVVVAIRPERIRMQAGNASASAFSGQLVDVIYLGSTRKYLVRLPTGQECTVLKQADAAESSGLKPGDAVTLSWETEHATAFTAA